MTRERSNDVTRSGRDLDRRAFIAVGGGVGATLLAGCTSESPGDAGDPPDGSGGTDTPSGGAASFRLLVSDAPADIDDFDRLDVTFSRARVFPGTDGENAETETDVTDGTETETDAGDQQTATREVEEDRQEATDDGTRTGNGTATGTGTATETEAGDADEDEDEAEDGDDEGDGDGDRGFYVLDLDDPTVDLTQVVGDRALPIFDGELEAGSYRKLELHVGDVEGIVDGETVEVMVPSGKLQLTKPFELAAGEELDFVFDVNVVKRGRQASYNLKPVVSQSGVRGKDVEVEEVDEEDAADGEGNAADGDDGDDEDATDGEEDATEGDDASDGDGEGTDDGTADAGDDRAGNETAA